MKKKKSPYYGVIWILVWTAALVWFYFSDIFTNKELIGLAIAWATLVSTTVYFMYKRLEIDWDLAKKKMEAANRKPSLNGPCPCGSGKKYKRCCAEP